MATATDYYDNGPHDERYLYLFFPDLKLTRITWLQDHSNQSLLQDHSFLADPNYLIHIFQFALKDGPSSCSLIPSYRRMTTPVRIRIVRVEAGSLTS